MAGTGMQQVPQMITGGDDTSEKLQAEGTEVLQTLIINVYYSEVEEDMSRILITGTVSFQNSITKAVCAIFQASVFSPYPKNPSGGTGN